MSINPYESPKGEEEVEPLKWEFGPWIDLHGFTIVLVLVLGVSLLAALALVFNWLYLRA